MISLKKYESMSVKLYQVTWLELSAQKLSSDKKEVRQIHKNEHGYNSGL